MRESVLSLSMNTEGVKRGTSDLVRLEEAMERVASRSARLRTAVDQSGDELQEAGRRSEEAARDLDKMGEEAREAAQDLDRMGKEAGQAGRQLNEVGRGSAKFGRDVSDGARVGSVGVGAFAGVVTGLTATLATAGVAAVAAGGAFAAIVGRQALEEAKAFSVEMSAIAAITGATSGELASLTEQAREMGATTMFSATQAAEGLTFLSRAGFDATQSTEALPGVLNLAASNSLDLGRAADIASNVLSGFAYEAERTGEVVDVLAKTAASSNTDIEQLGEAMKFAAPVATALGLSLEETAASVGKLSDAGIQGGLAGRGLNAILSGLTSNADEVEELIGRFDLAEDGLTNVLQRLAEADVSNAGVIDLVGAGNLDAFKVLETAAVNAASGTDVLTRSLEEVSRASRDGESYAKSLADIMRDNLAGDIRDASSAYAELLQVVAESGLQDAVRDFTQALAEGLRSDDALALAEAIGTVLAESVRLTTGLVETLGEATSDLRDVASGLVAVFEAVAEAIQPAVDAVRTLQNFTPSGLIGGQVASATDGETPWWLTQGARYVGSPLGSARLAGDVLGAVGQSRQAEMAPGPDFSEGMWADAISGGRDYVTVLEDANTAAATLGQTVAAAGRQSEAGVSRAEDALRAFREGLAAEGTEIDLLRDVEGIRDALGDAAAEDFADDWRRAQAILEDTAAEFAKLEAAGANVTDEMRTQAAFQDEQLIKLLDEIDARRDAEEATRRKADEAERAAEAAEREAAALTRNLYQGLGDDLPFTSYAGLPALASEAEAVFEQRRFSILADAELSDESAQKQIALLREENDRFLDRYVQVNAQHLDSLRGALAGTLQGLSGSLIFGGGEDIGRILERGFGSILEREMVAPIVNNIVDGDQGTGILNALDDFEAKIASVAEGFNIRPDVADAIGTAGVSIGGGFAGYGIGQSVGGMLGIEGNDASSMAGGLIGGALGSFAGPIGSAIGAALGGIVGDLVSKSSNFYALGTYDGDTGRTSGVRQRDGSEQSRANAQARDAIFGSLDQGVAALEQLFGPGLSVGADVAFDVGSRDGILVENTATGEARRLDSGDVEGALDVAFGFLVDSLEGIDPVFQSLASSAADAGLAAQNMVEGLASVKEALAFNDEAAKSDLQREVERREGVFAEAMAFVDEVNRAPGGMRGEAASGGVSASGPDYAAYVNRYPDLQAAFERDWGGSIESFGRVHYENHGQGEGRTLAALESAAASLAAAANDNASAAEALDLAAEREEALRRVGTDFLESIRQGYDSAVAPALAGLREVQEGIEASLADAAYLRDEGLITGGEYAEAERQIRSSQSRYLEGLDIEGLRQLGDALPGLVGASGGALDSIGAGFLADIEAERRRAENPTLAAFEDYAAKLDARLGDAQFLASAGLIGQDGVSRVGAANDADILGYYSGLSLDQRADLAGEADVIRAAGGEAALALTDLGLALRDFTDAGTESLQSLRAEGQALQSASDRALSVRRDILGGLPAADARDQLASYRTDLSSVLDEIANDDLSAEEARKASDDAAAYVSLAQRLFGGTEGTSEARDFAAQVLEAVGEDAGEQASEAMQQLTALETQVTLLGDIKDILAEPDEAAETLRAMLSGGDIANADLREVVEAYVGRVSVAEPEADRARLFADVPRVSDPRTAPAPVEAQKGADLAVLAELREENAAMREAFGEMNRLLSSGQKEQSGLLTAQIRKLDDIARKVA